MTDRVISGVWLSSHFLIIVALLGATKYLNEILHGSGTAIGYAILLGLVVGHVAVFVMFFISFIRFILNSSTIKDYRLPVYAVLSTITAFIWWALLTRSIM